MCILPKNAPYCTDLHLYFQTFSGASPSPCLPFSSALEHRPTFSELPWPLIQVETMPEEDLAWWCKGRYRRNNNGNDCGNLLTQLHLVNWRMCDSTMNVSQSSQYRIDTVVFEMSSLAPSVWMAVQAVEALFQSGVNVFLTLMWLFSRCLLRQLVVQNFNTEL